MCHGRCPNLQDARKRYPGHEDLRRRSHLEAKVEATGFPRIRGGIHTICEARPGDTIIIAGGCGVYCNNWLWLFYLTVYTFGEIYTFGFKHEVDFSWVKIVTPCLWYLRRGGKTHSGEWNTYAILFVCLASTPFGKCSYQTPLCIHALRAYLWGFLISPGNPPNRIIHVGLKSRRTTSSSRMLGETFA